MTNQPIFLIETDLNYEYVDLLNDVIKYITVLVILHVLLNYEYGKRTAIKLANGFFTNDFLNLVIFIMEHSIYNDVNYTISQSYVW